MMPDLTVHPEYERLSNEIEELKEKISVLYMERDNLLYHQCPHIKAEYMVKVGAAEYKVFESECKILRIKRKIELIQQKINKREAVVLSLIDLQLDEEYKEWVEKLAKKMDEINEALKIRSYTSIMTDDESAELRQLYMTLIKKLHPDLNPSSNQEMLKLFHNTVDAYKRGDLSALRTIKLLVEGSSDTVVEYSSVEIMRKARDACKAETEKIEKIIANIKSSFPYNEKAFITDDAKVKARYEELELQLLQNETAYKGLEERLSAML
jgi:hypothetical protein